MNAGRIIKNRILEMFTEDNGKLSLSRVCTGSMVLSAIVWVSYVIAASHPHALPDLTGPAVFTGGGAAHYGIGKWFAKKDDATIPGALADDSKPPDVTLTPGTTLPKKN